MSELHRIPSFGHLEFSDMKPSHVFRLQILHLQTQPQRFGSHTEHSRIPHAGSSANRHTLLSSVSPRYVLDNDRVRSFNAKCLSTPLEGWVKRPGK
jgi:hypothetical protein